MDGTLDELHAVKLDRLADRENTSFDALATSLLSAAIDRADPDAALIQRVLEGIPGLAECLEESERQYEAGNFVDLDGL